MKKHKKLIIKNKKIRIIGAIVCIIVLLTFISWVIIWIIWWYKLDITLMKVGIRTSIIAWIFMWILHILYFRTSENFRKKLFGL